MEMIDRKTGKIINVPDAFVQSSFQSGRLGIPKGTKIPMSGSDGVGYVAAEDANRAFAQGQRIASPEEVQAAHNENLYGGVTGGIKAVGQGIARGLSLGLYDPYQIESARLQGGEQAAEAERQRLVGLKEANPYLSTGGEIAGAVAPFLIPGGAARTAGALQRGIAGIGDLAGETIARGLGEGIVPRIASTAASGAVQGAAQAAGQEVSEASLGNTELTGEKLLAAVGHGALIGGATGGALQATGEVGSFVLGKLHPRISGLAEDQAVKLINARKAFTGELNRIPGGSRAAGRLLLDEGIIAAGDTVETVAPKIEAAADRAGQDIGVILDTADRAGIQGPQVGRIVSRARNEILPGLKKMELSNAAAIGEVDKIVQDFTNFAVQARQFKPTATTPEGLVNELKGLNLTFREAQDFRSTLDSHINWWRRSNPLTPVNEKTEAMIKLRGIIEDELINSGETAAKAMGGSFKTEYEAAKLKYRQLTVLNKAAKDAVERVQANAALSLTDKLAGAGVLSGTIGRATHLVTGGLGGLAGAAIASKVSKIIRTKGNSTSAVVLDKLAAIGGIRRAQAQVDKQISRGVSGLFSPNKRVPAQIKAHPLGDYEKSVNAVSKAIGQAQAHAGVITDAVGHLAPHAPQITNAFERAALRATIFLASKIPPGHRNTDSLTPQLDKPHVTDAEKEKFLRYVQAVHDPATVLESMRLGSITPEHVEAIREVYPELYGEIRQQIAQRLTDTKHPLDYGLETRVRRLFGLPAMDPAMVGMLQANFSINEGGKKGKGGGMGPAPPKTQAPRQPLKDANKFAKLSGLYL